MKQESDLALQSKCKPFDLRLGKAVKIVLGVLLLTTILFVATDVLLLVFAGILFAVFLSSLADWTSHLFKIKYGWGLGIVCLLIVGTCVAGSIWVAPDVSKQFEELTKKIPESLDKLRSQVEHFSWAQPLLRESEPKDLLGGNRKILNQATGILSGFLGVIANAVIIIFIGLYGAAEPGVYKRGFLHLIPLSRRQRYKKVLEETNETLKWWLIGKFISMSIIGILTTIGLWLMDVPLALILGIIAALLTFIPNIGPLLSAVPAVLLGLMDGPMQAVYIAGLYVAIQTVESYLITPLIQRRTVKLPPGLTLGAQVLLGVLFGGVGVAIATPMTAVGLVITKRLYVEDSLGDQLHDKDEKG